jgi:hypothetical protein
LIDRGFLGVVKDAARKKKKASERKKRKKQRVEKTNTTLSRSKRLD